MFGSTPGLEGALSGGGAAWSAFAAGRAWVLRMPGARLADLVWDGDVDGGRAPCPDLTEGPPGRTRLLCFAAPDGPWVSLEVERRPPHAARGRLRGLEEAGERARAEAVDVQVQSVGGPWTPAELPAPVVDDTGRFALPQIPTGPVRLVVRRRSGYPPVVTTWIWI